MLTEIFLNKHTQALTQSHAHAHIYLFLVDQTDNLHRMNPRTCTNVRERKRVSKRVGEYESMKV